jgi:hypothetical protein
MSLLRLFRAADQADENTARRIAEHLETRHLDTPKNVTPYVLRVVAGLRAAEADPEGARTLMERAKPALERSEDLALEATILMAADRLQEARQKATEGLAMLNPSVDPGSAKAREDVLLSIINERG